MAIPQDERPVAATAPRRRSVADTHRAPHRRDSRITAGYPPLSTTPQRMDMDMTREISDLDCLARYWVEKYAATVRADGNQSPIIGIVGAQADAIGTADAFGETDVENMAFLAGYLGFPCDAAYIAAAWEADRLPQDVGVHPSECRSVLTWTHCIPTRETRVLIMIGNRQPNGRFSWVPVDASDTDDDMFVPIEYAAHDFEKFPPQDGDHVYRKVARDLVLRDNGTGYQAQLLDSGSIMVRARNWTGV